MRSFSPKARVWVKTSWRASSGAKGAVVSRTMIAPGPPVTESLCRTTRASFRRSSPAASARRWASPAAVKAVKCMRLRASLVRVPVPAGPMCTTRLAQQANTGLARS